MYDSSMSVAEIQAEYEFQESKRRSQEDGRVDVFDVGARLRRQARDKAIAEAKQREDAAKEKSEQLRDQNAQRFEAERIEPLMRAYLATGGTPEEWAKIVPDVRKDERLKLAREQLASSMYRDF